mmetsp:Transcript_45644/g.106478  ORF Transcript_45644/g.106478 Transcript_45644/m.106478 type:complete len:291 (-) Transcript_45644:1035-1907(-)
MSAVATMHETAAANIGARSEPPETESSGPSTIETSSSGKHMNKFIVAMNAPALFVSAAARPTNAYGMTMNAEKGMPRTATLATARVGELIQPMLSKTAQWTSSQTKKTRPSPSRSTSRGVIGESASVTNDAKSMPRELARAPSLYRNLAGWSSSREGSGSPPHTCTPMYLRRRHAQTSSRRHSRASPRAHDACTPHAPAPRTSAVLGAGPGLVQSKKLQCESRASHAGRGGCSTPILLMRRHSRGQVHPRQEPSEEEREEHTEHALHRHRHRGHCAEGGSHRGTRTEPFP